MSLIRIKNKNRSQIITRALALMMFISLLSSCQVLLSGEGQSAGVASDNEKEEILGGAESALSEDEIETLNRDITRDNNNTLLRNRINREGRVIQLEGLVNSSPEIELPANDVIELNFEQENLQEVFWQMANALQINAIMDPSIDDRVSLRTSAENPLQYEDLWPLMRMLAENAGIEINLIGDVYEFTKRGANIPAEIVMPNWLNDSISSNVLQVTPLTYVSVETAETLLEPFLLPDGSVVRLGTGNLLGISGTADQLKRINSLLEIIDDDPFQNQGIHLYELLNSDASEVASELTKVLEMIEGQRSSYQILGLERINSILVIAPASRGFEEVTRWIDILDAGSQEQVEQLFFYEVKNLTATSLAATLTNVFGQNQNASPNVSPASVPEGSGDNSFAEILNASSSTENQVSANLSVTIVADEDTNSLLIRSTPRDYRQLLTTINNLDKQSLQVLINAVIGQVTLTGSLEYGVDWTRVSSNLSSGPSQLSSRVLPGGIVGDTGAANTGSGLVLTQIFADGSSMIDVTLQAIAQDNEVSILSRPTILAANNQEGEIKVGQAVPIDSGSTLTGNGTTVSNISYRDVGVVLTVTPHINSDGFISLEIFQSLSSVEDGAGGVSNNPIFTNQEITTTAIVENGSVITLGGLIQETEVEQNSGIPGLRSVPVVKGLFSFQEERNERRELFVILRPEVVDGNKRNQELMKEYRQQFEGVEALFLEAGL